MNITVIITTRNRCTDLERTCGVLIELTPQPHEVIITADGCTDETVNMIRAQFPQFRLFINSESLGSVTARDRMLRAAVGDVVVSLDDDSYPLQRDFLTRVADAFSRHPEASVLYFAEVWDGECLSPAATVLNGRGYYTSAFANCAAAYRRDIFVVTRGFPVFFQHMYEEPDYALQCYSLGWAVWVEPSILVRHHFSTANRHAVGRHHLHARNELWTVLIRCPYFFIPAVCAFRIVRQLQFALRQGLRWVIREPQWWMDALWGVPMCFRARDPVSWRIFFGWMKLSRCSATSKEELSKIFGLLRTSN